MHCKDRDMMRSANLQMRVGHLGDPREMEIIDKVIGGVVTQDCQIC